jgi:hypothetical protein
MRFVSVLSQEVKVLESLKIWPKTWLSEKLASYKTLFLEEISSKVTGIYCFKSRAMKSREVSVLCWVQCSKGTEEARCEQSRFDLEAQYLCIITSYRLTYLLRGTTALTGTSRR